MKRKTFTKRMSTMLCLLLPISLLPTQAVPISAEENTETNFYSSFEKEDAPLTWENEVELDAEGNEKESGVIGNVPYDGIQGDITHLVEGITASAENPPNEITTNLVDRNPQTKWLAFEPTARIEFSFEEEVNIVKYALTSANDYPERDPEAWELYGSNDKNEWTKLDEQDNQSFAERYERKLYEMDNDKKYRYYRLEISKNGGAGLTQLGEIAVSNGIDAPPPEPSNMKTYIGDGPTSSYTAKTNVGWTGTKALFYQGQQTVEDRGYSYNKIYDVNVDVTSETQLSYLIHPEFADQEQLDYSSTFVSIDLAFTDGTYLSELEPLDQHGVELNPQAQGKSKTLYVNQWNYKVSNIGQVADGKTIDRILVAYDNPKGPGVFRGSIDDLKIDGNPSEEAPSSPVDYVDILRGTNSNGTFSRGNNFPAVAVPHGFNFWTPVTDAGSTSWLYSYQQSNNDENQPELEAFALSHETSPWMGDRQTFQIMPSQVEGKPSADRNERALAFQHSNEIAKPYYYSVKFENGIQTEIAPTNRAAMFKFHFNDADHKLIFDNVNNNGGLTLNPEDQSLTGYTDVRSGLSAGATRMFVYATFDAPVTESTMLTGEGRDHVSGYMGFDAEDQTVAMRIATSLISVEQAKKNLEQDIPSDSSFEQVKDEAKKLWNEKLKTIEVEGASKDELTTLYSNMYRLFLYPNMAYENTGTEENPVYKYASPFSPAAGENTATETGAKIVNGKPYVNNGFWDTYRTTWPAYSLLTPTHAGEMIDGFVQQYKDGGWISRWSSPGYANLMVGTSSDVAFADAYLKGVTNFDVDAFYESALKNGAVASDDASVGRKGLTTSIFDGYTSTSTGEGMSWALDGYINDFAISNIAKELAEKSKGAEKTRYETEYNYYLNRAQNYVNMFHPEAEFFIGKNANGEWRTTAEAFDPREWGGDYTETNAWNMAFHVPQDGQGLANLYGSREAFAEKLDEFFSTPETAHHPGHYGGVIHEMREARDVRMGMYGHSNQPSHHIAYMYNYAGQPWKTQEKISEIMSRLYLGSEIGQGYAGDEDNGEMSAWYIFSAAGFYPLQMGSPNYAIGAPHFEKMTIHLENGKDIVIKAPNVSKENKYVQSLKVNGKQYDKTSISHELLANGATLEFEMGAKPSKWGTSEKALPTSLTDIDTNGTSLELDPLSDLTDDGKGQAHHSDQGVAKAWFDNTSDTTLSLSKEKAWVQYKFDSKAKRAMMYTLTSGEKKEQDPKSWEVIGSNDGKRWTLLDREENVSFKWRSYTQPFTIDNPGDYQYYRIQFKDNQGANQIALAEVEFLGFGDVKNKLKTIEGTLKDFHESGDVSKHDMKKLQKEMNQVEHQLEKNHYTQAAKKAEDFLKHLKKAKKVSNKAQSQLEADMTALKGYILQANKDTIPGKGKWKYREEVYQVPIFELSSLNIPAIAPGQDATVSVDIQNVGMSEGEKEITLSINGEQKEVKTIALAPEETQTVTFTVSGLPLGIHEVQVNDQIGTLKVLHIDKPVLSMSFDEEDASDQSPYEQNGVLNGNTEIVEGKFGKAIRLDGGWIEVPNSEFLNGGDELSIATWLKLDDAQQDQKIIGKTSIGNGYLLAVDGGIYPEIWTEGGPRLSFNEGEIPSQEWVHLALTFKKDDRLIAYINGEEVANISAGSVPILNNDEPLIIGGAPWNPEALQMRGAVDEVRIFKQALQPEEVVNLMNDNTIE
ncbi:GH92 family glycosyl hydrolase [Radiobacillus kanasensis]|uniref:GH92 family glycosyl hydrolase n=1 Tax=Radiobacillus kanasensis TaxID=2844358 RepID=UPI001E487832|nr:GH92 family glycosyl hydrolase [Radiobacillus kanasensis]UFT98676.1 GH92 family glycosyl hydrolase [Radiobacillus kanasensis]